LCCVNVAKCVPLLIQQNVNGSSVCFNRSWDEYKVGFNDSNGNYWLGNDMLSQLTLTARYKLRSDMVALYIRCPGPRDVNEASWA